MTATAGTSRCKMYPQSIPQEWRQDPRRRAELKLYDKFAEHLPGGWIVFYDVAWLARVRRQAPEDGQTDFIVLHPDHGLLLIELKGGKIAFNADTGVWTSTDSTGTVHEIKDAFEQVQRSKYALINKFGSIAQLSQFHIPIVDGVAFPDVQVSGNQLRMDAPTEVIIDIDDLNFLLKKVLSIFKYWAAEPARPLDKSCIQEIVKLLAPSVELHNPLSCQIDEESAEIIRLTDNQFKVFEGLRRAPRVAVNGCAGSGKTFLAIEKAKKLSNEGFKTLLLSYNRHLADHFVSVIGGHPNLTIKTFHGLCNEAGRSAKLEMPEFGTLTVREGNSVYPMLLSEAVTKMPTLKFDAIVVDEAQDLHNDWWDALEFCLTDNKHGIINVFCDDNQKLYKDAGTLPDGFIEFDLCDNIRNAQPIFKVVEHYYSGNTGRKIESRGPAGRSVEWHQYKNKDQLIESIQTILQKLIDREKIQGKDIVVLTPHNLEERSVLLTSSNRNLNRKKA